MSLTDFPLKKQSASTQNEKATVHQEKTVVNTKKVSLKDSETKPANTYDSNDTKIHEFKVDSTIKISRSKEIYNDPKHLKTFNKTITDFQTYSPYVYAANIGCVNLKNDKEKDKLHETIVTLMTTYGLSETVVNVLMDYSMVVNNNKIVPNYLLTIGRTCYEQQIDNLTDLINHLSANYIYKIEEKSGKKNAKKDDEKPVQQVSLMEASDEPNSSDAETENTNNLESKINNWF